MRLSSFLRILRGVRERFGGASGSMRIDTGGGRDTRRSHQLSPYGTQQRKPLWSALPPISARAALLALFALIAIAAATAWWQHSLTYETTDSAFVERDVLYLKPRIPGVLIELLATDNQVVKAGDLLARIDPLPLQATLKGAEAEVMAAKAQVGRNRAEYAYFSESLVAREQIAQADIEIAQSDVERQRAERKTLDAEIRQSRRQVGRLAKLHQNQQISQQQLEEAHTHLETLLNRRQALDALVKVAQARFDAAEKQAELIRSERLQVAIYEATVRQAKAALAGSEAQLKQSQLQLGYTEIRAPHDGVVSRIQARVGSQVDPSSAIAILVYGEPWVQANFKETQIGAMQPGDAVSIEVDAYPNRTFNGWVDSFQAGTGSRFSMLPPENATGNFVKVVQRVPVKIRFDPASTEDALLWPGMSVISTVHLKQDRNLP